MRRLRDESGFSLTELMSAMLLAVLLFGAAITTFLNFLDTSTRADHQNESQEQSRRTIERLAGQLRNGMSTGSTGAQPVQHVSDFDLVFLAPQANGTAPATNPRGLVYHRYCLGNANNKSELLWHQTATFSSTTQATAPPLDKCPSNGWPTRTTVANHMINRLAPVTPLFRSTTDASGNVIGVTIHARVDWNTTTRPPATDYRSKVILRNVNRPPTAGLDCKGLSTGQAICDASGSNDPDGQALSYAWKVDGAPTSDTTYRITRSGLSRGNHTVTVTVTDSGGATATKTTTVVIP